MLWRQVCADDNSSEASITSWLISSLSLSWTGVDPGKIMAELCMKDGGTCRGAGGSMHIYVSQFS